VRQNFTYIGSILHLSSDQTRDKCGIATATWRSWGQPDDGRARAPRQFTVTTAIGKLAQAFPNEKFIGDLVADDFYMHPSKFRHRFDQTYLAEESGALRDVYAMLFNKSIIERDRQKEIGRNWRNLYVLYHFDRERSKLFGEVLIIQGQDKIGVECLLITRRGSIYRGGLYSNIVNSFLLLGRFSQTVGFSSRFLNLAVGTTQSPFITMAGVMVQSSNARNDAVGTPIMLVRADALCPNWSRDDLDTFEQSVKDKFFSETNPLDPMPPAITSIRERFAEIDVAEEDDGLKVNMPTGELPGDKFSALDKSAAEKFCVKRAKRLQSVLTDLSSISPSSLVVGAQFTELEE
jgi:hypothetical protein